MADIDVKAILLDGEVLGRDGADLASVPLPAGVPPGGADGQILAKASGTDFDTEWVNQGPWRMVTTAEAVVTSGNITMNLTAITEVSTAFRLTLTGAQAGDRVKYWWDFQASAASVYVAFDLYTMVGGARVNAFGASLSASISSTWGLSGWTLPNLAGDFPMNVMAQRTLVSGDIAGGGVLVTPFYVKNNTTVRTLFANTLTTARCYAELWRPT